MQTRQAVEMRYLTDAASAVHQAHQLAEYFMKTVDPDGDYSWSGCAATADREKMLVKHALRWLVHHLCAAGAIPTLERVLSDPVFIEAKIEATSAFLMAQDYTQAQLMHGVGSQRGSAVEQWGSLVRSCATEIAKVGVRVLWSAAINSPLEMQLYKDTKKLLHLKPPPKLWGMQAAQGHSSRTWWCEIGAGRQTDRSCLCATLTGHRDGVSNVQFDCDGQLATASWDGTVRLWKVASGLEVRRFDLEVGVICFGNNGMLVAVSNDNVVKTIDIGSGAELCSRRVDETKGQVLALGFSADRNTLALACSAGTLCLWIVSSDHSLEELHTWHGHSGAVYCTAFSPDNNLLVTGSGDHTACLWHVETHAKQYTLKGHTQSVRAAAFSPDGLSVATGCFEGAVFIWSVETGTASRKLSWEHGVSSLAFSPNGDWLVAGSFASRALVVWGGRADSNGSAFLHGHNANVTDLQFNASGCLHTRAPAVVCSIFWVSFACVFGVCCVLIPYRLARHVGICFR